LRSEVRKAPLAAGFKKIEISIVAREEQPPHFQTILAGAEKSQPRSRGHQSAPISLTGRFPIGFSAD
jgi:hypothetical protein